MTRKNLVFNFSKAKIKELLEEVHFGNLENTAEQEKLAKKGGLSQNAFADTISANEVLQTNRSLQSNDAPELAADRDSSAHQDGIQFDIDGLDAREHEKDVILREQEDTCSSSKNSVHSISPQLSDNHQVSKNRKVCNGISKGVAANAGNALKNTVKNYRPKSGERDLKNLTTSRLKDNTRSESTLIDQNTVCEEKNVSRDNEEDMKENQSAYYTTSPAPSISNRSIGGDCNALDQRALANHIFPQIEDIECSPERMKAKIEELQICLLESSMEYEIKILELKMNMLHNKSQHPNVEVDSLHMQFDPEKMQLALVPNNLDKPDARCLDDNKDQLCKLQQEKEALTKELIEMRKRERQFEQQRQDLHNAIQMVNWLQRELSNKEEELVDCQSREMEAKARLREVQIGLESAQAARTENRKLSNLIPSLADWLQSVKKIEAVKCDKRQMLQVNQYEANLSRILEECLPPNGAQNQANHNQLLLVDQLELETEEIPTAFVEERMEVQALQRELEKLACQR
eukprot:Gb_33998 [translate_table: standard]